MNAGSLVALAAGAALVALLVLMVRRARAGSAGWDEAIAEHLRVTGTYPTVAQWRAGLIGQATHPAPPPPSGPVTVTVIAVDGKPPVTGASR